MIGFKAIRDRAFKRCFSTHSNATGITFANGSLIVDNPFTGETYCKVKLSDDDEARKIHDKALEAGQKWKTTSIDERIDVVRKFVSYFDENREQVAADMSGQMGKPLSNGAGEIRGLRERAEAMMNLAPEALSPILIEGTNDANNAPHFHRKLVREPVGVVLTLAPWNFPLLTAVNSVVPAVLAGNSVVLNHGFRAPLMSKHFQSAFERAGAPSGLVQALVCDYSVLHNGIRGGLYDFVSFTGSVSGGRAVNESVGMSKKFIHCTLELGGNDGAYVAKDCDLDFAVSNVVDGGLFNAGQSCCGIERVFVHESLYDDFLEKARKEIASAYGVVGDPTDSKTNMGPLAQPNAIDNLWNLVADAQSKGARVIVGETSKPKSGSPRLFSPTLLADCDMTMDCMVEENFGPIIAVKKVSTPDEAVTCMNASKYGLTAALFTNDESVANKMANELDVGTVFLNRCDYLDPYLAWQGRKDSGKGHSLSKFGFDALTRLKSYHFKTV